MKRSGERKGRNERGRFAENRRDEDVYICDGNENIDPTKKNNFSQRARNDKKKYVYMQISP